MKKKEIIIATTNKGKSNDFRTLFPEDKYVLKTLLDFPEIEDIEETGKTFRENAAIKAEYLCSKLNRCNSRRRLSIAKVTARSCHDQPINTGIYSLSAD